MTFSRKLLAMLGAISLTLGAAQMLSFRALNNLVAPGPVASRALGSPVLGTLSIPRLSVNLPILKDDDAASLAFSVGHIPGTSPLGSLGNAGLAGHRDTTFRPLRNIRVGDRIRVFSGHATTYVVSRMRIVDPGDTRLLREDGSPELTLVTCYPFDFVGSAPLRFVIQARMTMD